MVGPIGEGCLEGAVRTWSQVLKVRVLHSPSGQVQDSEQIKHLGGEQSLPVGRILLWGSQFMTSGLGPEQIQKGQEGEIAGAETSQTVWHIVWLWGMGSLEGGVGVLSHPHSG